MEETKGKYVFEFRIHTGFVGGIHEDEWDVRDDFTEEQWDVMDEGERQEELQEFGEAMIQNNIELYWEAV